MIGHLLKMKRPRFAKNKIETSFYPSKDWSPFSYWNFVETEVYEGRSGKLFASEAEESNNKLPHE